MSSREQFEEWWQDKFHNGNPPRGGWNLYREGDDYSDEELDGQWAAWKASRQALEIALPVLEQQEKGDYGWIEWGGGECPVPELTKIQYRTRLGNEYTDISRDLRWSIEGLGGDIIAYRVVQERERGEGG
ncbi:hypothetical protein [Pantoea sp.]|uniref:hypothetical protein n=1 Tax=Pantoea sp. TaxID=69393 RepID=UPI002911E557|nr:hypothetical protein [Pantoea sp.]MDU5476219.1 hypothetical protein [Pantoea sp.]